MSAVRWLMRLMARLRYASGACIICGVGGEGSVCFNCYWRWTFDGWRPWWLARAVSRSSAPEVGE